MSQDSSRPGDRILTLHDMLTILLGMDAYDRERAHHQAKENARDMYDQQYGDQDQYDPNNSDYPQQIQSYGGFRNQGGNGGGY